MKIQHERRIQISIYGDMNYYGNLLKVEGAQIYYNYGCRLDNMTGVLLIDTEKGTWTNNRLPQGIEIETIMFRSFANKVLRQCKRGEYREKVSRDIG